MNIYFRENVIIRGCVNKHVEALCGSFTYQRDKMKGCLLTCDEDFCNGASRVSSSLILAASLIAVTYSIWITQAIFRFNPGVIFRGF